MAIPTFKEYVDGMQPAQTGSATPTFTDFIKNNPNAVPEQPSNKGIINDTLVGLGKGVMEIPSALTGLADIPAGLLGANRPFDTATDAIGRATGFQPKKWAEEANKAYSPKMQDAKQNVDDAWNNPDTNGLDVAKAYIDNPRAIAGTVTESIPSMLVGNEIGVGAKALGLTKTAAGAAGVGEGAIMAGQSMDNIDKSVDPQKAALGATAIGIGGGLIGTQSGRFANKLGLGDVDQAIISGGREGLGDSTIPMYKRVLGSAITEGPIEEGSQSALETGVQNYVEDKPLTQGMGRNVVEGSIAGVAMGAPMGVASGPLTRAAANAPQPEQTEQPIVGNAIPSVTPPVDQSVPPVVPSVDTAQEQATINAPTTEQWKEELKLANIVNSTEHNPRTVRIGDKDYSAHAFNVDRIRHGKDTLANSRQAFNELYAQQNPSSQEATQHTENINGYQESTNEETTDAKTQRLLDESAPKNGAQPNLTTETNDATQFETDTQPEPESQGAGEATSRSDAIDEQEQAEEKPIEPFVADYIDQRDGTKYKKLGDNQFITEKNYNNNKRDRIYQDETNQLIPINDTNNDEGKDKSGINSEGASDTGINTANDASIVGEGSDKGSSITPTGDGNTIPRNENSLDGSPVESAYQGQSTDAKSDLGVSDVQDAEVPTESEQAGFKPETALGEIPESGINVDTPQGETVEAKQVQDAMPEQVSGQSISDTSFSDTKLESQGKQSEQKTPKAKGQTKVKESTTQGVVTPILTMPKGVYITQARREYKKANPNVPVADRERAMADIKDSYDTELDKALASLSYNEYKAHPASGDAPDNLKRQGYDALRSEYKITDETTQPQDNTATKEALQDKAEGGIKQHEQPYIYHATSSANIEGIKNNGLTLKRSRTSEKTDDYFHVSTTEQDSEKWAKGLKKDTQLRFKPTKQTKEGTYPTTKKHHGDVKPWDLEIKENGEWKPLVEDKIPQPRNWQGLGNLVNQYLTADASFIRPNAEHIKKVADRLGIPKKDAVRAKSVYDSGDNSIVKGKEVPIVTGTLSGRITERGNDARANLNQDGQVVPEAGAEEDKKTLQRKSLRFWKGESFKDISEKVLVDKDVRLKKESIYNPKKINGEPVGIDYILTDGRKSMKIPSSVGRYIDALKEQQVSQAKPNEQSNKTNSVVNQSNTIAVSTKQYAQKENMDFNKFREWVNSSINKMNAAPVMAPRKMSERSMNAAFKVNQENAYTSDELRRLGFKISGFAVTKPTDEKIQEIFNTVSKKQTLEVSPSTVASGGAMKPNKTELQIKQNEEPLFTDYAKAQKAQKSLGKDYSISKVDGGWTVTESELSKALKKAGINSNIPASKSVKLRKESEKLAKEAHDMLNGIVAGQPVFSTRDRNLRERSFEKMRKSAELMRQADEIDKQTTAKQDKSTDSDKEQPNSSMQGKTPKDTTKVDTQQNTTNASDSSAPLVDDKPDDAEVKQSQSKSKTQNPHTKSSLIQSMRKVMDSKFYSGWFSALEGTGAVEFVSNDEAKSIINGKSKFHKVWHGSPHDHNKFDSSKIGTGEGAQAFGYGHYFTDEKSIAEYYRDNLSNRDITYKGKPIPKSSLNIVDQNLLAALLSQYNSVNKLIDYVETQKNDYNLWSVDRKSYLDLYQWLVKIKVKDGELDVVGGKLYEVELAPTQDEYLDWDKSLSEQSNKVKSILAEIQSKALQGDQGYLAPSHYIGKEFYDSLGAPKTASKYLHSIGIRGIRYKAEGGKSDANNYVIFDDNDIKIEAKYSKNGDILAFYNPATGKTHFVYDNISKDITDNEITGLVTHEIAVHALKLGLNDKAFQDLLKQFEKLKDTNPKVQAAFDRVPTDTKEEHKLEESLSYFLELEPSHSLSQRVISLIRKALRAIGRVLPIAQRAKWIKWANTLDQSDIISMATDALRSAPTSLLYDDVSSDKSIRLAQEKGYKGNNKGESEEWLRAVAKGLDMSKEARMQRAKDMGFDVDNKYYHGTAKEGYVEDTNIKSFDKDKIGDRWRADEHGFFFTNDKEEANYYANSDRDYRDKGAGGGAVYPVYLRKDKPLVVDNAFLKREGMAKIGLTEDTVSFWDNYQGLILDWAKAKKANSVVLKDETNGRELVSIFDGKNIRSINAAFDPAFKDSHNILSSTDKWQGSAYDYTNNGGDKTGTTNAKLEAMVAQYANVDGKPSRAELKDAVDQYRTVEAKYFNKDGTPRDGAMLSPSLKPTNLNKMQWIQVQTPNFKKWFARSRAVDVNGDPAIYYHGTDKEFTEFDVKKSFREKRFFFTNDKSLADIYGDKLIEVFLSANNIKDTKDSSEFIAALSDNNINKQYDGIEYKDVSELGNDIHQIVVFNPSQIKSATGNTGTFSPQSNDIRFSIASDAKEFATQSDTWKNTARNIDKLSDSAKNNVYALATMRQMVDIGKTGLNSMVKYLDAHTAMNKVVEKIMQEGDSVTKKWEQLVPYSDVPFKDMPAKKANKAMQVKLADTMHYATVYGQDPTKPYSGKQDDEEAKANHRYVSALYGNLNANAKEVFRLAADTHTSNMARVFAANRKQIENSDASREAKDKMLESLTNTMKESSKIYFPLSRFGDYWLYFDKDGIQYFNMFETEGELRTFKESNPDIDVVSEGKKFEASKTLDGVSGEFIGNVNRLLEEISDPDERGQLQDAMYQLYLQSLPDISSRKHFIHRNKTPGYHEDALRGFAHKVFHDAKMIGRLENRPALEQHLLDMREAINAAQSRTVRSKFIDRLELLHMMPDDVETPQDKEQALLDLNLEYVAKEPDAKKRQRLMERDTKALEDRLAMADNIDKQHVKYTRILNELQASHDASMTPNTAGWATFINSIGFMNYLGFSASAAIVNTLQTPVVSLPYMASRYGFNKVNKELGKAFKEFYSGKNSDNHLSMEGVLNERAKGIPAKLISGQNITEQERKALQEKQAFDEMHDRGILTRTRSMDLIGLGEEGVSHGSLRRKLMYSSAYAFNRAEVLNREVTGMTAFRLAMSRPGATFDQAINYADEVINTTHGDYTSGNRARIMRGNVSRVVTQFKQYSQMMTYLWGRTALDAIGVGKKIAKGQALTDQDKEAVRLIKGMIIMQGATAGLLGLPIGGFMVAAQLLADGIDDDDDPIDIEAAIKSLIYNNVTDKFNLNDAIVRGPLTAWTGVDFQSRLNQSDMWFREPDRELEGQYGTNYLAETLGGPIVGIAQNILDGKKMIGEDHMMQGIEKLLPKAIKDPITALRYHKEGARTLRHDLIEDINIAEAIAKAGGFNSADLSLKYDQNFIKSRIQRLYKTRYSHIMDMAATAKRDGDVKAFQEAKQEILEWNKTNPDMKITMGKVLASVKQRNKTSKKMEDGFLSDRRLKDKTKQFDFAD